MRTVAIHQPEYWPWLGFLDKARRSDVFVLLDDVQFNRASLQQRAKIGDKPSWLTIPFVHKHPQRICDVEIADPNWGAVHLQQIHDTYKSAPEFRLMWPYLVAFYETRGAGRLSPAIEDTVNILFDLFGVTAEVVRSSALTVDGMKGERVLNICKALGATRYLSGASGAAYLEEHRPKFTEAGIEIAVQSYETPQYRPQLPDQKGSGKGLSALDALVYLGEKARELIA